MTIDEAREYLAIDKNHLDLVCETHASIFEAVSTELASAINRRDGIKDELEVLYADKDSQLREAHAGEKGWTEARIENTILMDREYQNVKEDFDAANALVNSWGAVKEAYSQRGYMIRELCEIYKAGYFNTVPETTTQETAYEMGRERLRDGRG